MSILNDIAQLFPITNPTWIFLVVLVIILFAPLIFNRIRIPHLVGMILAGVLVGEHGLNILTRDSSFELFGKVGLYYIMFLASLEMDMEGLKKNRVRGIIFGLLTFIIPFILGFSVGQWVLGFRWDASLLLSCILASHTLVAYPIVGRYGLSRHDCVTIAIAGTMIALLLALFTLAGISASAKGDISASFWIQFALKCAIYCIFIFYCYPRLTRSFFKKYSDNVTQFTFVLVLLILSAALSELAGLEGLFGAFIAGLVLNRYIPRVSPLMNRIEFVGNALFIPYFLIGVGMLINVKSLFDHKEAIFVVLVIIVTATATKWLGAWATQLALRMRRAERKMLFGLSNAHAAGALAMIMVGTRLEIAPGIYLIGDDVVNGVVLMILVSCVISSLVTDRAARQIALSDSSAPTDSKQTNERIMVALNNPESVEQLIDTAIMMRNPKSQKEMIALQVCLDNGNVEQQLKQGKQNLERAAKAAAAADMQLSTYNRVGVNVVGSIMHSMKEFEASELILGLHHKRKITESYLGTVASELLDRINRQVIIVNYLMPVNVVHRIIVAVPERAELEAGFYQWVERVSRMGEQLGCRIDFHAHPDTIRLIRPYIQANHPSTRTSYAELDDWNDLLIVTQHLSYDHLFVLVSARRGGISWQPAFDNLPTQLMRHFSNNSLMIIYPEQFGQAHELSYVQPLPTYNQMFENPFHLKPKTTKEQTDGEQVD
ncbi:MAG: cation:proton antiporter [Bacteroidaceae bacterium]|nr:cation:proton antiporter [Bacteroidaceae bacterium]